MIRHRFRSAHLSTRRFGSRKRAIFELIVFSEGIHNLPRIFQFVSSSRLSVPINVLKWSQYVEQVQQRGRSASLSFMYAIRLLLVRPFWSLTVNQRNPGIKVNGLWRVHVKKKQEEKKVTPDRTQESSDRRAFMYLAQSEPSSRSLAAAFGPEVLVWRSAQR